MNLFFDTLNRNIATWETRDVISQTRIRWKMQIFQFFTKRVYNVIWYKPDPVSMYCQAPPLLHRMWRKSRDPGFAPFPTNTKPSQTSCRDPLKTRSPLNNIWLTSMYWRLSSRRPAFSSLGCLIGRRRKYLTTFIDEHLSLNHRSQDSAVMDVTWIEKDRFLFHRNWPVNCFSGKIAQIHLIL